MSFNSHWSISVVFRLYPLLGFATMSVKSNLLSLYENYFLPLGPRLTVSLSGLILALLPGLEEGTETFDR